MLFRSFPPKASMSLGIQLDLSSIQAKLGDLEERGTDNMARIERQLRLLNAGMQKLQNREPVQRPCERALSPDNNARRSDLQDIREELAGLSRQLAALADALERATAHMHTPERALSRAESLEHADAGASALLLADAGASALVHTPRRRDSDASDSSFCLP
jgi:polyhydroxyalkanoate synthesis regulator phasin